MDSGSARFFLLQSGAPCDGGIDGNVIVSVHLLKIGSKSHQQKADQRYMIFFTEIHQPLCGLRLQVENIKSRVHRIGNVDRGPQIRVVHSLPLRLQKAGAVDAVIDGLRSLDELFKICRVPLLRRGVRFVGQIPLHLLQIGGHILRIGHTFIFCVAVDLDDIL